MIKKTGYGPTNRQTNRPTDRPTYQQTKQQMHGRSQKEGYLSDAGITLSDTTISHRAFCAENRFQHPICGTNGADGLWVRRRLD